jgi:hypothetical protein
MDRGENYQITAHHQLTLSLLSAVCVPPDEKHRYILYVANLSRAFWYHHRNARSDHPTPTPDLVILIVFSEDYKF